MLHLDKMEKNDDLANHGVIPYKSLVLKIPEDFIFVFYKKYTKVTYMYMKRNIFFSL